MIAKSYKNGDVEIILTKVQDKPLYGFVRLVKNAEPKILSNRTYEDANDFYEYYMDMELENDK